MRSAKCSGRTKQGRRCHVWPMADSEFCAHHDEERQGQRESTTRVRVAYRLRPEVREALLAQARKAKLSQTEYLEKLILADSGKRRRRKTRSV